MDHRWVKDMWRSTTSWTVLRNPNHLEPWRASMQLVSSETVVSFYEL
jgi:hypothetical protein